jgi:MFS family permease
MPRVRRLPPARLSAPVEAVRAAAIGTLGGTAVDAHTVRVPVGDQALAAAGVDLVMHAEGDSGTVVTVVGHGRLDIPFFRWAFRPLVAVSQRRAARYALARLRHELEGAPPAPEPKAVMGLPTAVFTDEQTIHLASAAAAVAVVSFAAALVGQMGGPISHALDASDSAWSNALAVTRLGALPAFLGIALADRWGRRRSILVGVSGSAIVCGISAFAPNLYAMTVGQTFQRAFLIMTATVATVAVVEEAPEGARAYATSMLALAGGFGFSISVIILPLADIGEQAWRIPFALGALSILLTPAIGRRLAETKRYEALARTDVDRGRVRDIRGQGYGRRFLVLAAVAFLLNIFSAPSSQLANKYLTDLHSFSNSGIALFRTVTTGIPGLFGLVLGGRLAEVRGRRAVAAIALTIATATQMVFFLSGGALIWVMAAASIVAASAGGIALGTLGIELFPTETRSTSNGLLGVIGVFGSALGFLIVSLLARDHSGELGRAIAYCGIGALLASVLLVPLLPESHAQALDDVSPTDARPPDARGADDPRPAGEYGPPA